MNKNRFKQYNLSRLTVSIILIFFFSTSLSQMQQGKQEQQMGSSTGFARTYPSKRTVGIIDEKAPKIFEDVTAQTPLANFKHISGGPAKDYILETTAGGVAAFDYDNDGKTDIYLLNGSTFGALQGKEKPTRAALYRNLGNWKFEDVTEKSGVANERWGMGVTVGDYNNDGYEDLYVSNYGVSRLYKNNGNGTFTDVAEKLGVARKGWSAGASFGDYDSDGRLDLFVPGYLEFELNNLPPNPSEASKTGNTTQNVCQFRGVNVMCGPRGLKGEADTLYHQKADGTFEDVSDKTGVNDSTKYYGLTSVWIDVNNDGRLDLLVVNDSTPKQLYINKGYGKFEEVGYQSGIALSENGREQAGMGLAVGDYNNDGLVDFHITNFSDDYNTLYHNEGDANFTDISFQAGFGEVTIPFLGWGTGFTDYDNDGWKDLIVVNGHVYPSVDNYQWGTSYAQQMLLFKNNKEGRFDRIGAAPNSALALAFSARGLSLADFDEDGKLDAVVNCLDGPPKLLKNVAQTKNHWLALKLIGDVSKKSSKDAIGATVYVTTGKLTQRFDVISGASYASQNDLRLHIGLGNAVKIDKLAIRWPGGTMETVPVTTVDKTFTIVEGKGLLK